MSFLIGRGRRASQTYPTPGEGGGGGGANAAVVFDPSPPGSPTTTIRSNRSAQQSPVHEPVHGSSNFGSTDGLHPDVGVTGNYASVLGGLDNSAIGERSVVLGGDQCTAFGEFSIAGGTGSLANSFDSIALGFGNVSGFRQFDFTITAGGTNLIISGNALDFFPNFGGLVIQPTTPAVEPSVSTIFTVGTPTYNSGLNETTVVLSAPIDATTTGGIIVSGSNALYAVTIGEGCKAAGLLASVAMGDLCSALGRGSFAAGSSCSATGAAAASSGQACSATGDFSACAGGLVNMVFGAEGLGAFAGAGLGNSACGGASAVVCGEINTVGASFSFTLDGGAGTLVATIPGTAAASIFVMGDPLSIGGLGPVEEPANNSLTVAGVAVVSGNTAITLSGIIDNLSTFGTMADTAYGAGSFIGAGTSNTITGPQSAIVSGTGNTCAGPVAGIVAGSANTIGVTGNLAFIGAGSENQANGEVSGITAGMLAVTSRTGQLSHNSATLTTNPGDIQTSLMTLIGTAPTNTPVVLTYGNPSTELLALDNQKNYFFSVEAVLTGDIGGVMKSMIVKFGANLRCTGGVAAVAGTGQMGLQTDGDAGMIAAFVSLAFAPTTNLANLTLTTNGAVVMTCAARVQFTEIVGTGT